MSKQTAVTIEEIGDTTVIRTNGVEVDISANRDVVVHTTGHVESQPMATGDTAASTGLKIGDEIQENGVVTGIYAGDLNGRNIFAAPQDAKNSDGTNLTMSFNEAADYAKKLNQENYLGHNTWHVPTREELDVLHENRNKGSLKGSFNLTGADLAGYYWSSSPDGGYGGAGQQFSTGDRVNLYLNYHASIRCVR